MEKNYDRNAEPHENAKRCIPYYHFANPTDEFISGFISDMNKEIYIDKKDIVANAEYPKTHFNGLANLLLSAWLTQLNWMGFDIIQVNPTQYNCHWTVEVELLHRKKWTNVTNITITMKVEIRELTVTLVCTSQTKYATYTAPSRIWTDWNGNNCKSPLQTIFFRLNEILAPVMCNLPKYGCLCIIGDADYDLELQYMLEADVEYLTRLIAPNGSSNSDSSHYLCNLNDITQDKRIQQYLMKSERLVEFIIVNNTSSATVLEVAKRFAQTGYLNRWIMYSGHGHPDGTLQFEDERLPYETIADALHDTPIPGLTGSLILNCCNAHEMLPGRVRVYQTDKGIRVHAPTNDETPELPGDGILGLIATDNKQLVDSCELGEWLQLFPKTLSVENIESLRGQFTNKGADKLQFRTNETPCAEAEDGLYMFPVGRGDCFLFKFGNHSLLFDTGYDLDCFSNWCWNSFIKERFKQLDVVIASHHDQDHIHGLFALLWHENLNKEGHYPLIKEIWLNAPQNTDEPKGEHRRSAEESRIMAWHAKYITSKPGYNPIIDTQKVTQSTAGSPKYQWTNGKGFTAEVYVINPSEDLYNEMLKKQFRPTELTRSSKDKDNSITNKAAIALYIRVVNSTKEVQWDALLCSDVPEDQIFEGLEKTKLVEKWPLAPTVVTLPHHGSDRNCSKNFCDKIKAKHVLVSTDGSHSGHNHPSAEECVKSLKDCAIWSLYKNTADKLKKWNENTRGGIIDQQEMPSAKPIALLCQFNNKDPKFIF